MTTDPTCLHDLPSHRRARWITAGMIALLAHLATAALALRHEPNRDFAVEDVGAMMVVEFAALPVSPESDAAEASEAADAAAPAPEIDEQLSTKSEAELPTAAASPYEAPPELQVAQDKTLKEVEEQENDQTTEATEERPVAAPSAAAQQSAAATPESANIAEIAAAPAEGSTAEAVEIPESWYRAVMAHLGKHKRYPPEARSAHVEGEVELSFTLDSAGRVVSTHINRSSGSPVLDREAVAMLERAQPLPAVPKQVAGGRIALMMPIRYRLK
jgi:protein TonB